MLIGINYNRINDSVSVSKTFIVNSLVHSTFKEYDMYEYCSFNADKIK